MPNDNVRCVYSTTAAHHISFNAVMGFQRKNTHNEHTKKYADVTKFSPYNFCDLLLHKMVRNGFVCSMSFLIVFYSFFIQDI